ncbi:MAG TPA: Lrp/AsnC family transcriptional regulator, partial [Spirochaetota bacterium]
MRQTKYSIDPVGEQILEILERDSRTTHKDIARQLNIEVTKVDEYVEKLISDHIIVRYTAQINWERIRSQEVRALIEVRVSPEHGVGFDSIAESVYRFNEVRSCVLLSGGYDLLVQVEGASLQDVASFVSEKLATIKGVLSTVTHFHLKTFKESG